MKSPAPFVRSTSATPRSSLATTTARSVSDNWPFEQNLTSPLRARSAEGKRFCLITTPINCPRRFRQPNERTAYKTGESAGGKAICETCSRANAEPFCRQCTEFICNDCVKLHGVLKMFVGHKIVTLQ